MTKESPLRHASRRIQDIVAEATGTRLHDEAVGQLEHALAGIGGLAPGREPGEDFSSREVTILLADLRGFTAITAAYPAGVVLEILNRCFGSMSQIIVRHHGTIDKFMGDSIMVIFFGNPAVPGEDVKRAVKCAVEMQIAMEGLNRQQKRVGIPELFMGIGINTGTVMAGLLGSELYSAYTVIGEDVNLASRIEAFSLRGQILISDGTHRHCGDFARTGEPMEVYVKGRSERVRVRELLGIPSLGMEVPRQEIRRSPRVQVSLPFSYQVLEQKIVIPRVAKGVILDIGYHGVLVEVLDGSLPLHAELKLGLELPLVAYETTDVYARVVKAVEKGRRRLLGLEFTSMSPEATAHIQLFVQMLIQGSESRGDRAGP